MKTYSAMLYTDVPNEIMDGIEFETESTGNFSDKKITIKETGFYKFTFSDGTIDFFLLEKGDIIHERE